MTQPKYAEWEKIKVKDRTKAYKAQERMCKRKEIPIFITMDGKCPFCNENYLDQTNVQEASLEHITFCKLCAGSFVE